MSRLKSRVVRRKRRVAAVAFFVIMLGAFLITPALAVHDLDFQLDGNVATSPDTNVGGTTQEIDWADLFDANGGELALPAGFTASGFDPDFVTNANGSFNTSDNTTFATGSKDTLPITPGWQCNVDNNVLSKNDVMNAYAASYEAADGDEILYFALERNANTGTANVAFWFLQDDNVNCVSPGGSTAFTGDHVDGDLLIVSEFSQGGVVSTIQVYEWVGGANGSLNPNPVASGASCTTALLGDTACAIVNTGTITTPWSTANKQDGVGHSLRVSEFFEGGLNLTQANLGGRCFNVFMADTRSSTSLTATLFDFSRGQLGQCTSTTETTPSLLAPTTIEADGTIDVTDSATVTVDGVDDWSGTLTFFICGPIASGTCSPDTGDQLGLSQTVSDETTFPVSSATATITEAGRYCFRAEFGGDADAGVPGSEDSRASECFVIDPRQPTLDTQAVASPVDFGDPVQDNATLSGTANQPGTGGIGANGSINPTTAGGPANGTITFTLKKANCTDNATGTGTNPQTVSVSGDNTYGPVSFTPDAPGDYHWIASYSGDSPNTLSASHNLACTDSDEDVTVRQIATAISTNQKVFPQDSATITSAVAGEELPAGGTVTFRLFGPTDGADPKTALANCQEDDGGGQLYERMFTMPSGAGDSETFDTDNTTVSVNTDDTFYWKVTYDPNDTAFTGRQSDCIESVLLDFTNDAGPGTLFP